MPRCCATDARLSPEPDDGMQMPADGLESNRADRAARLATILLSALASGAKGTILKNGDEYLTNKLNHQFKKKRKSRKKTETRK
ncbi:MAG: hypothetical protein IJC73_01770 [Lentisphaeria bacterium]|nr:hypothetical protein [Lentisphaeria bacterium]